MRCLELRGELSVPDLFRVRRPKAAVIRWSYEIK